MKDRLFCRFLSGILLETALVASAAAQATVSTGSIRGTVTDPAGLVIPGALVTITGKTTAQVVRTLSSNEGDYSSGALVPGDYAIRVEAHGFRTAALTMSVHVGITSNGDLRLQLGSASEVVEVVASALSIESQQATVQGVVSAHQIDYLPVNGLNFLELAQIEPGVQIQDGTNFDPTKVGYSSISFGGRFGRTARIVVDGVDISDETVGTTTGDIPSSGIQEFQLSQSNLDLSTDLTSSGAVNVVTRSGSDALHGDLFYQIRDSRLGAQLPHPAGLPAPYQRQQYGGRVGGSLIKNRLFFFLDYERTKQDSFIPVYYAPPFQSFSGGFSSRYRKNLPMARLDWQATRNLRLFFRFNYFSMLAESTFYAASLQPYKSKNYTRSYVAGADFNTGQFTHSIRFQYLRFQNDLGDAVLGTGLPFANLGLTLSIVNGPQTGPSVVVPESMPQLNRQIKYDGGRTLGKHLVRYGVNYNFIEGGGFFSPFNLAPLVQSNYAPQDASTAAAGPFPGGAGNPLNYPVEVVLMSNGQGYYSEKPGLGFPAGLFGPDHRFAFYVGDTWKIRRSLTLNFGIRYVRDTARTNSDLPAIPELDALIPGTGGRVHQPNLNFAPQVGLAWDLAGSGRTVIRAGAGLFYENLTFNGLTIYDRPLRLAKGTFTQYPTACFFGQALPIPVATGTMSVPSELCSETIGQAAAGLAAFQRQFQSLNRFNLQAENPNYVVRNLENGVNVSSGMFGPGYKSPRSLQMNAGIQRELFKGTVLSVDFLRNVVTHTLLGIDMNHVGDAKYFNRGAAQAAIRATLTQYGANSISDAIARGATMADFAANGLTSPALDFGGVCPLGYGCAFPGINPKAPLLMQLQPIGRSVYNALDVKLRQNLETHWAAIKRVNLQAAYSLSRFANQGGPAFCPCPYNNDQDAQIQAVDFSDPLKFMGPSLMDRTHQFSFGGYFDLRGDFRASTIMHFYSGLAVTPIVPNTNIGPGEIFRTDFTGDGTVQDILPGSRIGSFNRDYGVNGLAGAIRNYNQTSANQATPAGKALIDAGLFTLAQLQAIGGVMPVVPALPAGQVGVGGLKTVDLSLSWIHKFGDRIGIEPKVSFFNLFNSTNFDLPPNVISGLLNGSAGSINGTTPAGRVKNRVGLGTGVFGLAAPRAIELGMRIAF